MRFIGPLVCALPLWLVLFCSPAPEPNPLLTPPAGLEATGEGTPVEVPPAAEAPVAEVKPEVFGKLVSANAYREIIMVQHCDGSFEAYDSDKVRLVPCPTIP